MKKILLYSFLLTLFFGVVSCDKETEDISRVTTYAAITYEGDAVVYVEKGGSFTPSATSSGGEDVTITESVDVNKPGFYNVSYSATNVDGFDAVVDQLVIVYEEDDVLAGVYDGIREGKNGGIVLIYSNGDGTYSCSDLIGGYYQFGKGYGAKYASPTSKMEITGNIITADPGAATPWGSWDLSNGVKNGNVLTWKTTLIDDGFGFNVQLTKKSF
ncbi:immunoglobulin-like domain-containing protein [Ancylomarina longa]|uniref:DUF5011 domain-containing protein n=1 Tax=Ancylomarina longa TaxID=2487017 RepID=A0A434AEV1_9BACT|nr:immunoglobulin-like domain-containing protein [Ancylomarina longa]RUT72909.1 DUF5011 domain-containing protein [Ancylomarina longa]